MPGTRPAGEIYLPLAVGFASDPKVRALAQFGADAGLARDLFVQMCCHCKANLTDGFVAEYELGILVYPLDPEHGKQLAKQLASVALISEVAGGWQVVAYLKRNGTREDVAERSKVRAEAGRVGGSTPRKKPRQTPRGASAKQFASDPLNNGQALTPPIAETETETKTEETLFGGASAAPPPARNTRGTRIPDSFTVTEPMKAWFATHCPHVDGPHEHRLFVNYWRAKAGKDATKVNWELTWQNWMLKAEKDAPTAQRSNGGQRRPTTDDALAALDRLKDTDEPRHVIQGSVL